MRQILRWEFLLEQNTYTYFSVYVFCSFGANKVIPGALLRMYFAFIHILGYRVHANLRKCLQKTWNETNKAIFFPLAHSKIFLSAKNSFNFCFYLLQSHFTPKNICSVSIELKALLFSKYHIFLIDIFETIFIVLFSSSIMAWKINIIVI